MFTLHEKKENNNKFFSIILKSKFTKILKMVLEIELDKKIIFRMKLCFYLFRKHPHDKVKFLFVQKIL